jgi:ATP-dependent helicase/nuclease subunit A
VTTPHSIPDVVLQKQIAASDPAVSAWVAANAGSGKTHVLAQRVIRLLLDGVSPEKILCITFTKAAAANMANRVFDTLRGWTALDDTSLDRAIGAVCNARCDSALRARARRLFALALETPGGLKVQTIHAFCTRLLQQFPFEANVAARFEVLDEVTEAKLLDQVSLTVLLDAAENPAGALGQALSTAIASAADRIFKEVVAEAIGKRDVVRAWIAEGGSVAGAIAGLCGVLGIAADDTVEAVDAETVDGALLPSSQWAAAAQVLDRGGRSDQEHAARLRAAARSRDDERADIYRRIFLTNDGVPRQRLVTRAIDAIDADFAARLVRERDRVASLYERRKALACRDRTRALLTIAEAVIARYQAEKDRRALLDYDDLIDKTLALLETGAAAWVHYKLDRGIDHVLIDEAQDTSPRQWRIIRALTAEFFAGAGARTVKRTIFAVGDEKQSIFSFQGAAPREFAAQRSAFDRLCRDGASNFRALQFDHSFRSGENVLGAVDAVFKPQAVYASVTSDAAGVAPHVALPDVAPGLVEIWETLKPDAKREIEAWDAPFDLLAETNPQARLAQKIARKVGLWIGQGAAAGDVLVLVRQRGPLFEAIIRALKDAGIAVAGADRLVLTEHIAVMDLMVLADALLLPEDDLALATVLKSPLFGLDDDDLFTLAWQRKGSLRRALRLQNEPRFAAAARALDRLAEAARRQTPFDFFAGVLGPERGRRQFLGRLGAEANDALDEFLSLALDYERRETPSLQGFLSWLRAAQTDVKRDMEMTRDEVRVMTVHGAKGLEAPIVVLADTITPPAGPPQRQPRLLPLADARVPKPCDRFIWAAAKKHDVAAISNARERARREAEHEYRRLLYVAMTRAIDRLIVCGAEGERSRPEGCWYDLVFGALAPLATAATDEDGGKVWRFAKAPVLASPAAAGEPARAPSPVKVPEWLDRDAAAETPALVPRSPSQDFDETVLLRARGTGADRQRALARGELMHRLLQSLPDVPVAARADAAQRYLARNAGMFTAEEQAQMLAQVARVLDDARFAALFAPGSRAEVPIVGRLDVGGGIIAVAGQVDRLVVTPEAVLIADYKTNRPAPACIADVPPAYVTQLALYRAVLGRLYPGRRIRAALVWTETLNLMELSAESLDRALAGVKAA